VLVSATDIWVTNASEIPAASSNTEDESKDDVVYDEFEAS
jgi:hypothetical protein